MLHIIILTSALFAFSAVRSATQDDYQPGPDSIVQPNIPQGELIKDTYTAKESSVFPGTVRDYTIYLPAGFSKNKPAPFMVFQDGIIYNAPVVFDNLIAKKQIPPLIGLFIKPGIVPAANPNALPRDNRSYEYDSVTDTYARFLIDEFLPAIEKKHSIKLSTDPNDAAIAGNSSGAICAFMATWHRPDRIRRVFSAIGTYVGIRGGDQLPVLVRKYEPKPLRIFLQDGENDNNIYCGDWWMANQMMERALTWAGYDVNHVWGTGGHNQKHATAIFPDVMRWLWRDYATAKEIKANPKGESKWVGYKVLGDGGWREVQWKQPSWKSEDEVQVSWTCDTLCASADGMLFAVVEEWESYKSSLSKRFWGSSLLRIGEAGSTEVDSRSDGFPGIAMHSDGNLRVLSAKDGGKWCVETVSTDGKIRESTPEFSIVPWKGPSGIGGLAISAKGEMFSINQDFATITQIPSGEEIGGRIETAWTPREPVRIFSNSVVKNFILNPDQTQFYVSLRDEPVIVTVSLKAMGQAYQCYVLHLALSGSLEVGGLCVDTNGWLYVATSLGVQVLDQAGRVNFIIPTPQQPHDVCFGGKDLSELFIVCGDKIYKRPTKARGYISGQMAPIKPVPRKL